MPQPALPPTPAPSTDISGKEQVALPFQDPAFNLPPSAIRNRSSSPEESTADQDAAYKYTSPTSSSSSVNASATASNPRKRTSSQAALPNPDELAFPPPPTRSRKIIQVKPKGQDSKKTDQQATAPSPAISAKGSSSNGAASGGRKKQTNGSNAGRKIARKTAHSLIERRRRSKMNEEFGVLKDMIPACAGHEMHKLAILQASIDYLRYLEGCLADVKANGGRPASAASSSCPTQPESRVPTPTDFVSSPEESEVDDKVEEARPSPPLKANSAMDSSTFVSPPMSATMVSPAFSAHSQSRSHRASLPHFDLLSPAMLARNQAERPSYGPYNPPPLSAPSRNHSNQTSPMLLPQSSHSNAPSELDQEASAALLMLNASDRRTSLTGKETQTERVEDWRTSATGSRGISVKDLLSP